MYSCKILQNGIKKSTNILLLYYRVEIYISEIHGSDKCNLSLKKNQNLPREFKENQKIIKNSIFIPI